MAAGHAPYLPAGLLLMGSNWDNARSLRDYRGPVEIFAAREDTIIPARHAGALGSAKLGVKLHLIGGGHNDWPLQGEVKFRNP